MTISEHIKSQYFVNEEQLIRLAPSQPPPLKPTKRKGTPWTDEEHNRFLEALEQYPAGPWKLIAEHVRTRTTRQTMTHAQRYREKIARRRRTLAEAGLPELSIKDEPSNASTESAVEGSSPVASAAGRAVDRPGALEDDSESDDEANTNDDDGDIEMKAASAATTRDFTLDHDVLDMNNIEFEDIQDEELLLSLLGATDPLQFSEDDARWLTEHYGTISLEGSEEMRTSP
ncbi:Myb-like dna-binding protein [Globisporangium polare]